MSKSVNNGARRACGWRVFILLLLAMFGVVFARSAHARPVDEPNTSSPPIIGISIGNAYSSVGVKINDSVHIIPDKYGNLAIPSVVSFTDTGEVLVGQDAVEILLSHPGRSITGFKRLLGRTYKEVGDFVNQTNNQIIDIETNKTTAIEIPLASGVKTLTSTEAVALVIKQLKIMAEEYLGEEIKETVVTVPAIFYDEQRAAMKDAGNIAGLDVVRVVNEQTAAGLAYELDMKYGQEKMVLVYNLDGTAFEAAVLWIEEGVFDIWSTVRNENISSSGTDIGLDQLGHLHLNLQGSNLQRVTNTGHDNLAQRKDQVPLTMANIAKDENDIREDFDFDDSLNADQALEVIDQVLREANLTVYDIAEIIPSGSSSRIPKLRSLLLERFSSTLPMHENIDSRLITTYGAAIHGFVLRDYGDATCCCWVDVAHLSVGVETAGGIMSPLIKRGTTVPTKKIRMFTTTIDNQTSVEVAVFKGERDFVVNNTKLGSLKLEGLIPAPRGVPELQITMEVDADGKDLRVILTERGSNKSISLSTGKAQLEPYVGPDWDLVEEYIIEWDKYAEEERITRDAIQERIVQGEDEILETTKGIIDRSFFHPEPDYKDEYSKNSRYQGKYPPAIHGWWNWLGIEVYIFLENVFGLLRW